jgi:hypothetical protein
MSMPITDFLPQVYEAENDPEFMAFVESHLPYIMSVGNQQTRMVEPVIAMKYTADYYGLLHELNILPIYYYVTLRCNGLKNSKDFDGIATVVVIPHEEEFTRILRIFESRNAI